MYENVAMCRGYSEYNFDELMNKFTSENIQDLLSNELVTYGHYLSNEFKYVEYIYIIGLEYFVDYITYYQWVNQSY